MKKYIIAILTLMVSYNGYSTENIYKCHLKNMKQISKNEMTFDIWIEWNTTSPIQFQGIQSGIDFDFNAIANGGKLTTSLVSSPFKNVNLFSDSNKTGIKIDELSKQIRITAFVITKLNSIDNVREFKIGTFKISNTVAFTTDSKPNLTWSSYNSSNSRTGNKVFGLNINSNKRVNTTNLINHKIENKEFVLNPSDKSSFIVYQDNELIHFYINKLDAGKTSVKLYDLSGKLVKTISFFTENFQTIFDIDKENLKNGVYVVKVTNNNNEYTCKLQIE